MAFYGLGDESRTMHCNLSADECGFNKEMPLKHTLEIKGASKVHGTVHSK